MGGFPWEVVDGTALALCWKEQPYARPKDMVCRSDTVWYLGKLCERCLGTDHRIGRFSSTRETVPPGWELAVNKGEPQLQLVQDDGKQALRMRSDQASFSLQKKIHISLQASPFLVWDWKVTELPKGGISVVRAATTRPRSSSSPFRRVIFCHIYGIVPHPKG